MTTVVASLEAVFSANTTNFDRGAARVASSMSRVAQSAGSRLQSIGGGITTLGTSFAGLGAMITAPFALAVNAAIEFESAFAGVIKTVDATDEQLADLRATILDMATDAENPLAGLDNAAVTLARIMELGGALGVPTEGLADFTEVIGLLAMTTDLTAESAATMVAQYANISGLSPDQFGQLGSVIVGLGNSSAATESQILEFMQRIAGIAETVGLADWQTAALAATMASLGIESEMGGTAITTIFTKMIEAVAKGGAELDNFAEVAGVSAEDFATAWETNPVEALQLFLDGFKDLSEGDQVQALEDLGLSGIRTADVIRRMSSNTDLLASSLDTAETLWGRNTAMVEEAEKRFATTEAQMNLAKNEVKDLARAVGEILLPAINDLLPKVGEWADRIKTYAEANPEVVRAVAALGVGMVVLGTILIPVGIALSSLGTILGGVGLVAAFAVSPIGLLILALFALAYAVGGPAGVNWVLGEMVDNVKEGLGPILELKDNLYALAHEPSLENLASVLSTPFSVMLLPLRTAIGLVGDLATALGLMGGSPTFTPVVVPTTGIGGGGAGLNLARPDQNAMGGNVIGGGLTWVGERGPELFVPHSSGRIIPNYAVRDSLMSGGGMTVVLNNATFNGVRDIGEFFDQLQREARMRG